MPAKNPADISLLRLEGQHISTPVKTPGQVVADLGAMQSQDYTGALWSIALRTSGTTEKEMEEAIAKRGIIRTWPMRGTLHFVAADDIHWMLPLLTPRVIANSRKRHEELELDIKTFTRIEKIFVKALQGGKALTRESLFALLESSRIPVTPQRGYHMIWRLAQEGVLCHGSRQGKQPAFVLLHEWSPRKRKWERNESLAELADRYFSSHGPATLHDFAWWSGLKMEDARMALDLASSKLVSEIRAGKTTWRSSKKALRHPPQEHLYLLSGFDEYLLGYQDRSAMLESKFNSKIVPGNNGVFLPTIVVKGKVVGTWKRIPARKHVKLQASFFEKPDKADFAGLKRAADRYSTYLNVPILLQ